MLDSKVLTLRIMVKKNQRKHQNTNIQTFWQFGDIQPQIWLRICMFFAQFLVTQNKTWSRFSIFICTKCQPVSLYISVFCKWPPRIKNAIDRNFYISTINHHKYTSKHIFFIVKNTKQNINHKIFHSSKSTNVLLSVGHILRVKFCVHVTNKKSKFLFFAFRHSFMAVVL